MHLPCGFILVSFQDITALFASPKCPAYVTCEFADNDCWYVTFDSEEGTQKVRRVVSAGDKRLFSMWEVKAMQSTVNSESEATSLIVLPYMECFSVV